MNHLAMITDALSFSCNPVLSALLKHPYVILHTGLPQHIRLGRTHQFCGGHKFISAIAKIT